MRVSVLQFPGSNCDHDCTYAFGSVLGCDTSLVWHGETQLPEDTSLVIVPGGFSYGDYLRCGAIAAHAPIMAAAKRFAEQGGAIVGICNGFQILTESRLLPGALLRNENLSFVCKNVTLRVDSHKSPLTAKLPMHSTYTMPIAHMEGNFTADAATLDQLERQGQVVLRYVDRHGEATNHANPNGAARNIAGVANARGNVIGLMPHPERAIEALLGGTDGRTMLRGLIEFIRA